MSVIRPEFNTSIATQILNDVQYLRANIFYYLGKINPWTDDIIPPPEPELTPENDTIIRNNIVFMKKVSPVDASIVTTRYSWESGVVFEQWDHTIHMQNKNFYCVTDDFNVYKCLNNNNGVASTVKPTGTSVQPVLTSDGYLWKYMYSIPPFKQLKFVSSQWIPVQKALTDNFYNRGAVEQVEVLDNGSGYTDALQTQIIITDSTGSDAILIPSVSRLTGEITKVTIINGGENYTNPTLSLIQSPITGTGKFNSNPSAILKAIVQDGVIVNVSIEDPGQNYPADTATTILVQGDGQDAAFTPVIYQGQIIDVIVDNPGLNYSTISLQVIGDGVGAKVQASIGVSDFLSDQSVIEQVAIPGAIYSIKVVNGGNNYTATTTMQITGDGQGAAGYPVIGPNGSIDKVVITSYGSGYTRSTITFTDPNRLSGVGYTDATAYAILPPNGGHGFDAVKELYGRTVLIYTLIKDEEEITLFQQDYRQYGLIENPLNLTTNKRITSPSVIVTFDILFSNTTRMARDDVLLSNNVQYRVVNIGNDNVVKLQQLSSIYKQPGSTFALESDPNVTFFVVRVVDAPTANKYSGNLMYVTNEPPLITTEDQAFAIRTYIRM